MNTYFVIVSTDSEAFKPHPEFPQLNAYLLHSIPRSVIVDSKVLVRTFTVGKEPVQLESYKGGLSLICKIFPQIYKMLEVQYLDNDIARCNKMKPSGVVEWLCQATIHKLLGHFHQGRDLSKNPDWSPLLIEAEMYKLKFHLGFPSGAFVSDPLLLQDKFNYLSAINEDTLPTLKIPLIFGTNYVELIPLLNSFCMQNVNTYDPSHIGFVIKIPYTTNQKYRKINTIQNIVIKLNQLRDKFCGIIPYVMLQAYLHDTVEYKVVCFNGKALYEAKINNSDRASFHKKIFSTQQMRFEFAESVLRKLKVKCPFAELSSLIRVDMFWCSSLNKIVVNELESLEARFDAGNKDANKQIFVQSLLTVYHANTLINHIGQAINQQLELIEYPTWPSKWEVTRNVSE